MAETQNRYTDPITVTAEGVILTQQTCIDCGSTVTTGTKYEHTHDFDPLAVHDTRCPGRAQDPIG